MPKRDVIQAESFLDLVAQAVVPFLTRGLKERRPAGYERLLEELKALETSAEPRNRFERLEAFLRAHWNGALDPLLENPQRRALLVVFAEKARLGKAERTRYLPPAESRRLMETIASILQDCGASAELTAAFERMRAEQAPTSLQAEGEASAERRSLPPDPSRVSVQITLDPKSMAIGGVVLLGLVYLGATHFGSGAAASQLSVSRLTIGVVSETDKYQPLADYLKKSLVDHRQTRTPGFDVAISGGAIQYSNAKQRIKAHDWDVVFTASPMLSLAARDAGYRFIATQYPSRPAFFKSCLFVKADSPITSIDDITPDTTVGLANQDSASGFYMPVYDLYGKSLTIHPDLRTNAMKDLVEQGQLDVGAAALSAIRDDKKLRVIKTSRDIPGSGVYASPTLSESDFQIVRDAFLNAPDDLKSQAEFAKGSEPDYSEFAKIAARTDAILNCARLDKNPVTLSCQ